MYSLRKLGSLAVLMLAFSISAFAQVNVTATAGTTGSTNYTTLGDAFTAINAGTHQGAITIDIIANTTESRAAVLNSNAAVPAAYTSVLIRPIADGVTIAGPTMTGRGLIELNGADNITIDGDNPNTAGTNRNLTITNTAAATVTFTSVIRLAVAATVVTSADNNIFRNLILNGSATGKNTGSFTSTSEAEANTYGILASGGASTANQTTAPSAITSVSASTAESGATASNLTINNNFVTNAGRAISVQGSDTTVFPGLQINNNTVGNPIAGSVDGVYASGIGVQGSANALISGNTVYVEGFVSSSANGANQGISVGSINPAVSGATIERNRVKRVRGNYSVGYTASGINLAGGNNHIVRNNFVEGVTSSINTMFATLFSAFGISVRGGTGHQILNNSVNMSGARIGTGGVFTAAFALTSNSTGLDVRNNIFRNIVTDGSLNSAHVSIFLPLGASPALNLTLNHNDYGEGTSAANNGIAQVGTISSPEYFYKTADFNPATTTPSTNLRAFTSPLSAAGTNDNASKVVNPGFISDGGLHISIMSPLVDMGVTVAAVTNDIDGEVRPQGTAYDIGADEAVPNPGTLQFSSAAYTNPETTTAAITIIRADGVNGAARVDYATAAGTATGGTSCAAGVDYINTNGTLMWTNLDGASKTFSITLCADGVFEPGETINLTLSNVMGATPGTPNTAVLRIIDAGTIFNGNINVGTGEIAASLTNPGGIFDALNNGVITGPVNINITSDLTEETGAIALNQNAGGFPVAIRPSAANRLISGTPAQNAALIKLNGADNVSINGDNPNDITINRDLTIVNNNAAGVVIWIGSGNTSGANTNSVLNCILQGGGGSFGTATGIFAGSGRSINDAAEFPNNNLTISNNLINRVRSGVVIVGNAATPDTNLLISDNFIGSTAAAEKLAFRGVSVSNESGFIVRNNKISGISSAASATSTMSGIRVAGVIRGENKITHNEIKDIRQNNELGNGSNGIYLVASTTASNLTVSNNFISDIGSVGYSEKTATGNGYGIFVETGGGYNLYHNTVVMNTNHTSTTSITAALNIAAEVTTPNSINVRNNIFANTQTVGTHYAVYNASYSGAAVFSAIDHNDYFAQNVGFLSSVQPTLADWRTATGQDANSEAVDPLFISATDFHLQAASPLLGQGLQVGIFTDYDNDLRPVSNPDIGADEIVKANNRSVKPIFDFDGDGKTDIAIFRPAVGEWWVNRSSNATGYALQFGNSSDKITPADFTGDGKTDVALFRPSTGEWFILRSEDGSYYSFPFGTSGDIPAPGDFDADGRADTAVFRPSNSTWYIYRSSDGGVTIQTFGQSGDVPVVSDYDGDGKADVAIWRPSVGQWWIQRSSAGTIAYTFGNSDDKPVQGDYTGDGKADVAIYRPASGEWFVLRSEDSSYYSVPFGTSGDVPSPGDYDGDGKMDTTVFRPAQSTWYVQRTTAGTLIQTFGQSGDRPVPNAFVP